MKVVLTTHARDDLEQRVAYSIEHFGHGVARRIFKLVDSFINITLAHFPFTGRTHPSGILEIWVPGTPFFILYRVDKPTATLIVLAVFHHAQDRDDFKLPQRDD